MKLFLFHFFLFLSVYANANTFFVAKNGNDANSGTLNQPWETIQKAAASLVAGDTVFIQTGTYNERVTIQNSGTQNNPIVFTNYQTDEVILDGTSITWWSWNGLFDISNQSHIVVQGIRVQNATYGGIWVENASHITIKNCTTFNTFSSGISCWDSDNILLDSNEIELACNEGEQECISVANSFQCTVSNNRVHNNGQGVIGGEGIDVKAGSHDVLVFGNTVFNIHNRIGIYIDAWDAHTYNISVFRNRVYNCSSTGMAIATEKGGLLENVHIYNNLSYANKWNGLEVGAWTEGNIPSTPIKNVRIINNTFYKNGLIDGGVGIAINNPDAEKITIRNNISSQNNDAQIQIKSIKNNSYVADHNLIYGTNDIGIFGSDSVVANPLFKDENAYNLFLKHNSPAIDKGTIIGAPTTDFNNSPRPYNDSIDIGAFEYDPILSVKSNTPNQSNIQIYPNPFTEFTCIKLPKNSGFTIWVFDITGKLVHSSTAKNNTLYFYRNQLNSGLYILQVKDLDNKFMSTHKLIIK